MKRIIGFFALLILVSCSKNFDRTYKGKIANKYDIVVTLFADNGKVEGEYFYETKGQSLKLNGNVDSEGNIILQETLNGKRTGVITAKRVGDEINGVWKNPNSGKELDFSVKETDINYDNVFFEKSIDAIKRQQEIDNKKLTSNFTSLIDQKSKVKTQYLGDSKLLFEIDVASAKCHRNAYKGIAKVINVNKAVFKKGNFELTLVFNGAILEIKSKGNDDSLGMFCYVDGKYSR